MMNKWPLLCVLSVAMGGSIGWSARGAAGREPSSGQSAIVASLAAGPAIERGHPSADDQAQLRLIVRAEMHSALKEELTAVLSSRGAIAAVAAADPVAPAPATPEKLAHRRAAIEEINTLLSGGEFSPADRSRFHANLAALDPRQRMEAMNRFGNAVNSGQIKFNEGTEQP